MQYSLVEKEEKNPRERTVPEKDFLLQWGNRRRLRCVKVKDDVILEKSNGSIRKKTTSRVDFRIVRSEKVSPSHYPNRFNRNDDSATIRSSVTENRKSQSSSPEKEDRYYPTRASAFDDGGGKISTDGFDEKGFIWPKFFVSLSSKEKLEDFMAMKGCKLPQRPKKRAKLIQRYIHLVSPGAWLSDLCQERYEVRHKKSSKKRPRGLKAMGSMESDSD